MSIPDKHRNKLIEEIGDLKDVDDDLLLDFIRLKNERKKIQEIEDKKTAFLVDFLNAILANNNKPPIYRPTDFRNIEKNDIINSRNIKYMHEIEDKAFALFSKTLEKNYMTMRDKKDLIIYFLKYMIKELPDINLVSSLVRKKDVNKSIRTYSVYGR